MKHILSLLTMALCLSCTARTAPSKMVSATASAAATPTARHFVITFAEGARLTAYLPTQPSGRAIVDLPGGGYSHLAVDHEGHQWADWMNRQGIAFFVLEYRMPILHLLSAPPEQPRLKAYSRPAASAGKSCAIVPPRKLTYSY